MNTSSLTQTATIAISLALVSSAAASLLWLQRKKKRQRPCHDEQLSTHAAAYERLIGNTPLVKLAVLSKLIERDIYVKMESLNPGGTGKDRAALSMIRAAEEAGQLPPPYSCTITAPDPSILQDLDTSIAQALKRSRTGGLVVEGTSGSTGIALATLCVSRGHGCLVVLPDDQAVEKQVVLKTMGAVVLVVPNVAISNPRHYVNIARRLATQAQTHGIPAVFTDQFENPANYQVHYQQTGPELYRQCPQMSAFCMSSGTGGTLAGVGRYLKEISNLQIQIVLVDPPGSALYHKIVHGVAYAPQQSEQSLRRHRYDTLAEGIGLDRVTNNLQLGLDCIDHAVQVTDQQAVDMAHWLLKFEGLWVGSSSAMNVVGAMQTARDLPKGSVAATVICDSGSRHVTRFWSREFVTSWGLEWPPGDDDDNDNQQQRIPECLQEFIV